MKTWIALLRGINVGGHNRLAMKALSQIFESAGCEHVRTYIQSGNVVFGADIEAANKFADAIGAAIEKDHGFHPAIHLVSVEALRAAIESNPYPDAVSEPKSLHLVFLERPPQEEHISAVNALVSKSESITVTGKLIYVHAPDGIARSKLANGIGRALRMNTTARNWRTVKKLNDLAST